MDPVPRCQDHPPCIGIEGHASELQDFYKEEFRFLQTQAGQVGPDDPSYKWIDMGPLL